MTQHGKVGPDHARAAATLALFYSPSPTHALSQIVVPAAAPGALGHRLFRAVPHGAPPPGGWPVLYMLDGNAAFDFLTQSHLSLAPGLVLVGVGYDTDRQFARERRTLDFTPPEGPGDGIRPDPVHPGRMAGGAKLFLDLLTGPLRTAAEAGLAINPGRRTLWGHSFGGLFTLYALLSRPQAFAGYAAISPSIWWDTPLMHRIAAAAAPLEGAPPPFLLALGDKEKRSGSEGPPPDGPAPATLDFAAAMARHPGHKADLRVLKDHVHIQTLPGSLPLALPFAAAPRD